VKRHSLVLVDGLFLAASSGGAAQQSSERDAVTPRIGRLEQWFSAIASHRPGAVDEQVRLVNTWNQEQLRQIWIDVSTIVSLVREPDVSLFYVNEPSTRSGPGQQGQLSSLATSRSTQVLYTVGELRRIRALVKRVSPTGQPGPENDIVKRGALLHADIALLTPVASRADAVGNAFAEGASEAFRSTLATRTRSFGWPSTCTPACSSAIRHSSKPGFGSAVSSGCVVIIRRRSSSCVRVSRRLNRCCSTTRICSWGENSRCLVMAQRRASRMNEQRSLRRWRNLRSLG
jgi:hypothetical protein